MLNPGRDGLTRLLGDLELDGLTCFLLDHRRTRSNSVSL